MKNKLKKELANNMNLYRFLNESECEYNQRLIYSAGAAWAKTLVFGHSYAENENNEDYVNVDIMYVEMHLSKVLEAYLKCFDINPDWIKVGENGDVYEKARLLASHIVQELLYTNNLAKIQSRKLIPLEIRYFKYGNELYLVRGDRRFSDNVYSVGVAQWLKDNEIAEYKVSKKIVDVEGKDYYKIMDSEFKWKKAELTSEYLIFKTGSKGFYSKSWKPFNFKDIPQGISILKLANEYNGGYVLIKQVANDLQIAELDPWYIEEREIYRILYALNYKKGTLAEFQVKQYEDYYILHYSSAIPNYEDKIITSCSWQYKTYDNKYHKIVPGFLWEVVENTILKLGIKIIY